MNRIIYRSPFIPEEWIAAHGLEPLRFIPGDAGGRGIVADTEGICPFMRSFINEASESDASAIVLTTVCDQMRHGFELLQQVVGDRVFLFNLPSTWQSQESKTLYHSELNRLGTFLVGVGGAAPSHEKLKVTMLEYEVKRGSAFSGKEAEGVPIVLLGGAMSVKDHQIVDLVRELGGKIVLDGTESGERTKPAVFDHERINVDPMLELAGSYFGTIPDAFRRPNSGLHEWFKAKVEERKPQGIIYLRQVWCDLWHAEVQRFRDAFDIPLLDLDLNGHDSEARSRTRVEAFMEALR